MESRWIWPFELQEKLGEGGMGVVYKARYVGNDRIVAIKLLPANLVENPTAVARFEREMELLKKLRHPNIVHCFGGTCESKQRFYAMEIVSGGNLEELLQRKGKLPWEQVVEYARQIAAALGYAHDHKIIHRDIKPANFLITPDGKLKLSDFGLASISSVDRLTAAGKTLGTFHYMSPEQIRGKPPLTPSSDLYAVGCVLYELLTGKPPFEADNAAAVLHMHLKQPPPRVAEIAIDCPLQLDRLVSDLLAKSPADRPADAAEVARRLNEVTHSTRAEVDVTPSPFARITPRTPNAAPVDSDASIRTVTVTATWPAIVIALLLGVLCLSLSSLYAAKARAALAESLWIEALRPSDVAVRAVAAESLGKISARSSTAMEAVLRTLEDPDARVREAAIRGLQSSGTAGRAATGKLLNLQKSDDRPEVRNAAETTLAAINSADSSLGWLAWTGRLFLALGVGIAGWWGVRHVLS